MSQRYTISGRRTGLVWLGGLFALILIIVIVVMMIIFLIVPQRQRQQKLEAHYKACVAFQGAEDWEKAVEACAQVIALDADYKDVQTRYANLKTKRQEARIREVAAGKVVTASSFWQKPDVSYPPGHVVDRRNDEPGPCVNPDNSYWLLPDQQTGWVQVDLGQNHTIVKLRWLNTHNAECADRATTGFHFALSLTGAFEGEELTVHRGKMAFSTSLEYQEFVLSPPVAARYVRFYVNEYYHLGGGLNELEVYAEVATP